MPRKPNLAGYAAVVRALKAMMAVERQEREPFYRSAAEAIVNFRQQWPDNWDGSNKEYKLEIARAYREAGVPSDTEGTVLAALRYHVGNVVREKAPVEELDAAGLDRRGPNARQRRGTPRTPRAASNGSEAPTMPTILSKALESPTGLVTHAIRAVEAAADLKPAGPEADTVRILLRILRDEIDNLDSHLSDTL